MLGDGSSDSSQYNANYNRSTQQSKSIRRLPYSYFVAQVIESQSNLGFNVNRLAHCCIPPPDKWAKFFAKCVDVLLSHSEVLFVLFFQRYSIADVFPPKRSFAGSYPISAP